ncbi:MAG: hypothetical protein IJ214_10895 [Clostridia bacterium]|nr:hypothetical protein [Clostridia bacterium]
MQSACEPVAPEKHAGGMFLAEGGSADPSVRREEKNSGGPLADREECFIPLKFSGRALLSAQENLHPEENDFSFSSGASTLSMP